MKNVFTANFRMLMAAGDWTQMEASAQLGLSQSMISRYLSGVTNPPRKCTEAIAYRLGVPVESMLNQTLTLPEARRLLQGKSTVASKLRRPKPQPHDAWMRSLKRRWQHRPHDREALSAALRLLFPEDHASVIKWLGKW